MRESWLRIDSEGFFGQSIRSPNGRFAVAWQARQARMNDRESMTPGKFLVMKEGKVRLRGSLPDPDRADIADNGTFVIVSSRGIRSSTFRAITYRGGVVLNRDINAWVFSIAISPDGHYAVCQAANNYDDDDDGGMLMFFDLDAKRLLWKKHPETGWANRYEFDTHQQLLRTYHGHADRDGCFRYSFAGECLDIEAYSQQRAQIRADHLKSGARAYELYVTAIGELGKESASRSTAIIHSGLKWLALASQRPGSKWTQARVQRLMGELFEQLGDRAGAISAYKKALLLDPKVGVKKRLAAIDQ